MKKKKVEFSSHTGNLAPMRKFVRRFLVLACKLLLA